MAGPAMTEPDREVLRAYLAQRDVACPGCGYNLRGAQDTVCPECGGRIELAVGRRVRGYWLLMLVAFGWVAIAAAMNATRDARATLEQARVSRTVSILLAGGSVSVGGGTLTAQSIIINGNAARPGRPVGIGGLTVVPTGAGTARAWSQVRWQTWLALGWSGALAVAGLAGLVLVLLMRGRLVRDGPSRPLLTAAVALVAMHLSVQVFLLVRELAA